MPETLHGEDAARTAAATSALLALARDPDADVRGSACTVPGVWDCLAPETVPALLRLARDPYARVRAAAAASRDRSVPASSTTTGSVGSGGGHGGRRTRRPSQGDV
ncbi:HEAT repeat domain-containing protein [Streptomyces sp. NPDC053813]|uniref:HEAT repeat domain-containing protein n=1 Tax=Streptomyces sp. NPDC053813 TaxID=3365717 RepID=UPI0037D25319